MKQCNKHSRSSHKGTLIECPNCQNRLSVYNFAWSMISCPSCGVTIDKRYWLFVKQNEIKLYELMRILDHNNNKEPVYIFA